MRDNRGRFKKGTSGNPKGRPPADRADTWQSALTGLGLAAYDKRRSTTFAADGITINTSREIWRGDDLGARIVETWPSEMLRQGWDLRISDENAKDLAEQATARLAELGAEKALWDALTYERGLGGGAILLGVNDGAADLSQPLNLTRIRSLDWLTALEPDELTPWRYYANPRAPKFGQPATYQLQPRLPGLAYEGAESPALVEIHESRLIIFPGIRVTKQVQQSATNGWGDSVFTRVLQVLSDFNVSWGAAGILVADFAQAVFKIKGLADLFAMDKDEIVRARMQAVELSRSTARAILIDAEEDFDRKQTPVNGLPELLQMFSTRLAAAADMPLTLLMGQSPGGLNATGESDIRFFYDRVKAKQNIVLRPAIEKLAQIVMLSMGKEPEDWSIEFRPLWQPTEAEQATARFTQAQTDAIYISNGVLSPEEVAASRFGGDGYSFDTIVDFAAREELEAPPMPEEAPEEVPPMPEEDADA